MSEQTEIDVYLSGLTEDTRTTLEKLRASIHAAVPPGTVECLAYGMPAFKFKKKNIAGFAAFKGHCSYFPMSGGITKLLPDALAKYEASKGAVQFPIGKPLPAALVKKLVKARLAEIGA